MNYIIIVRRKTKRLVFRCYKFENCLKVFLISGLVTFKYFRGMSFIKIVKFLDIFVWSLKNPTAFFIFLIKITNLSEIAMKVDVLYQFSE